MKCRNVKKCLKHFRARYVLTVPVLLHLLQDDTEFVFIHGSVQSKGNRIVRERGATNYSNKSLIRIIIQISDLFELICSNQL